MFSTSAFLSYDPSALIRLLPIPNIEKQLSK